MVDFLIAAGKRMHLIDEAVNSIFSTTPAVATNFPATALHDSLPSVPCRFGSAVNQSIISADLNLATFGNFELWTGASPDAPTGWTLEGSTTVTKETSNPIEGTASVRVDGAISRDYEVPTGAKVAFRVRMAEYSGSSSNAIVQLWDRDAGEWLDPATLAWTATETTLWAESAEYAAGGWDQDTAKGIVFSTHPYSRIGKDVTTLQVRLLCGGEDDGDEGIFDEISLVVIPNFGSVHGHNLTRNQGANMRTSGGSAFASQNNVATFGDVFGSRDWRTLGVRNHPSFYFRLEDNCPVLDGSSDYFANTSPAAMVDSEKFTFSGWFRKNEDGGTAELILLENSGGTAIFRIVTVGTNKLQIQGKDSGGTLILNSLTFAESFPGDADWHHLIVAVDLTAGTIAKRCQIWIDAVDQPDAATATLNAEFDFSAVTKIMIGSNDGVNNYYGALNQIYWLNGFAEDLDTAANREKFRSSSGIMVNLDGDGSIPSGGAAYIYLVGTQANPVSDFATNRGTGGNFTVIGVPGSELMFGSQRYWRLVVTTAGTAPANVPKDPLELAQWVLTRTMTLAKNQRLPYPSPRSRPMIEQRSPAGDIFRSAMSHADVRRFSFRFRNNTASRAEWNELRDRSGGGTRPVVIVPDSDKADVHFGYMSVEFPEERQFIESFPVTVEFEELPFVDSLT